MQWKGNGTVSRSPFPWSFFEKANLKFSKQQCKSLKRLGLFDEQIDLLQQLLPECAFPVRKQPPRTDLVSKLQAIEKPLMKARKALATLRARRSVAADEALLRIRLVDAAPFDDCASNGVEVLEHAIERSIKVLSIAQSLTGASQQRHKKAALFPIGKIDGILEVGFREHHERSGNPPPRYTLRVSRSGKFRDIVAICYEAIKQPNSDPDRAIRTYIDSEKLSRSQLSAKRSLAKRGRQAGKQS